MFTIAPPLVQFFKSVFIVGDILAVNAATVYAARVSIGKTLAIEFDTFSFFAVASARLRLAS